MKLLVTEKLPFLEDIMATKTRLKNGIWRYMFRRKGLLDKPVCITFKDEQEGDAFAAYAESRLAAGVVIAELGKKNQFFDKLHSLIWEYGGSPHISNNDQRELNGVLKNIEYDTPCPIDYQWVEEWVRELKKKYTKSSILKKVSFLRRAIDWGLKTERIPMRVNPCTLLPSNFAYKEGDNSLRERRLQDGEEEAIRHNLGVWEELLFDMALETSMRMSEMLHLKWSDINLQQRSIFLHRTKNGQTRQVPITTVLYDKLLKVQSAESPYENARSDYLFPFNKGGSMAKKSLVSKMSGYFAKAFEKSGCPDLHFHDLRHEAISRMYERTTMTDLEISKISGHRTMAMLSRYANLRASDLAKKMW